MKWLSCKTPNPNTSIQFLNSWGGYVSFGINLDDYSLDF